MPVDILWLHIRSSQACLWIFCGYTYEVYRLPADILWLHIHEAPDNACRDCVVAWKLFYRAFVDSIERMNVKCAGRMR
jgi:hypothetical protein